ncbi:MAG: lysophospholipid acyltransferase family protein [Proteobacteria bacterium]|nr:lysophospholipid acyltransferase family protein [Pseudomonadota bacterium]MBU1743998.1 lysophospholipid acyltransferase family protein [Pseudomonadota bacterium]MBU1966202.1 lysophospholipid acyltransferase family protein [Pseudomonadota bacterium]
MLKKGLSPNKFMAWTGLIFLKMLGWRVEGEIPDIKKFVIIAAPHTSNWDFSITLAITFALIIKIYWMGKAVIFRWPFGAAFRWLGGIPIDRSQTHNMVEQSVRAFNERDKLIMVIPPEGTRKKVSYWKTGFYHIARGANIPIVLGFLDYRRKAGGIGPTFYHTGRIEEDMLEIKTFYATIAGKRQDLFSNATFKS